MSFTDRKITDGERDELNVKSVQGNRLAGTAQENKNVFDRLVEFFMERYNVLIDDLTADSGELSAAEGIGSAEIPELKDPADSTKAATTVWKQIKAIVLLLTGHTGRMDNPHIVTKGQLGLGNVDNTADANKPISTAAQAAIDTKLTASLASDFVKNVTLDRATGTLTFYQHDGTSFSIDTILEKVPISCRLDGTDFVLTLDDGTEQRVSLAAFVDVYTFSSTDTVKFSKVGNAYTAEVPDGSIGREKLTAAVFTDLTELEQSARESAESANTDERAASASAELSSQKATEASASATLAESKATAARGSAESAARSETTAGQKTTFATTEANRAKTEADRAETEADRAASIVGGDFATKTEVRGYVSAHDAETAAHANLFTEKVDKIEGKGLSTKDYTAAEQTKLAGIATSANNYSHPAAHPANMITPDATHRFVSDGEKTTWNGRAVAVSYAGAISTEWVGAAAPYTQVVTVTGALATDKQVHIKPAYSATLETKIAEKEAWNMISDADVTAANQITFTCFEDKPVTAIPIKLEVIR